MSGVGELVRDVAMAQREALKRSNVLAQLRARPPVRGSFKQGQLSRTTNGTAPAVLPEGWLSRWPRLRFVLPALATAGLCLAWYLSGMNRPVPLTFAVGAPVGAQNARPNGDQDGSGARKAGGNVDAQGSQGALLEAPAGVRLPVIFSDGSTVALAGGARARVTALEARGATVRLEQGSADVSVRHRKDTRWQIRAGAFEVAVTGTRFTIDWDDKSQGLTVVMSEGRVEVRGGQIAGGTPIAVTAGQRFHATGGEARWTLAASSAPEVASTVPSAPAVPPGSAARPDGATVAPTEEPQAAATALPLSMSARGGAAAGARAWQSLARSGHYREALQAVERSGFEKACWKLGADELVELGDVARLSRDAPRAEQAYRLARLRFPRSDRPVFALGLVAFEQRQDFRAAGRWFDTYVRQYPDGPLAPEALGREMESWHRAGDQGRARRAARSYLEETPNGPYAPLARQIASP